MWNFKYNHVSKSTTLNVKYYLYKMIKVKLDWNACLGNMCLALSCTFIIKEKWDNM